MKTNLPILLSITAGVLLCAVAGSVQAAPKPAKPGRKDRCVTCGMFPAKYKQWIAQVHWKNGERNYFDGCKCMFRALQNKAKYLKGKNTSDMAAIYVTNYYTSRPIEGTSAFYVIGSDVLGPMGKELIPFPSQDDAREFMTDHKGTKILTYNQITPGVIQPLLRKKR